MTKADIVNEIVANTGIDNEKVIVTEAQSLLCMQYKELHRKTIRLTVLL